MMTAEQGLSLLASQLYQELEEGSMRKMRGKAWERFQEIGLPTSKDAAFQYVPLRKFFSQDYVKASPATILPEDVAAYIYPECRESFLVFVNGVYTPELSNLDALPKRLVVTALDQAAITYGTLLNNHWTRTLQDEKDPFVLLNTCLHENGAFIYLPPKTALTNPIQILQVISAGEQPMFLLPRLQVFVGAQSEVGLVCSQVRLSGKEECINSVIDLVIEESAHVHVTQALTDDSEAIWRFEAVRAHLKKNSTLNLIALTEGSASVRKDYSVVLAGENCEANLNGISMLHGKREVHNHVLIDHQAPNCRSRQLFKNVLNDVSRSSFEGKILVRQAAQKTDAFQLNNNLLISDRAGADSKPNLEIFADDVKASHGATFGQLDPEQLFMLKSRGISDAQAKNLLVRGFCKEIVDLIRLPSLLEQSTHHLQGYGA